MSQTEGKVFPGQAFHPPPATIWNNMVDAGRAWADGRLNANAGDRLPPRETNLLKLKNSSGANRRQGEILKLDTKVIETIDDENIWLDGIAVTDDCRFGILKRPLLEDEVDSAQIAGVCIAKVNVTDITHKFAVAAAGLYVLQSSDNGPLEILYGPDAPEEADCVVRFAGEQQRREAILLTDLDGTEDPTAAPSSATFAFLTEQSDGTLKYARDDAEEIRTGTVHHRLTFTIPAGTYIQVERLAGRWRPYVANCDATGSVSGSV